jgi:AcrR family transcriptional regulator
MSAASPSPRPDPLTEIVLCSTVQPVAGRAQLDRAPAPAAGYTDERVLTARSRAATVMARSRAAILEGARTAVRQSGTAITMAQCAYLAGVAKATLYNHFRTRQDVLAALLLDEIDRIIDSVAHLELGEALRRVGSVLSDHPLLEPLGGADAATLAVLARVDVTSDGWARVAEATEHLLGRSGRSGTPTVLRWLSSCVIAPADEEDIAADVAVLLAGLPPRRQHPGRASTAVG